MLPVMALIGLGVGLLGTLVGAGGGFLVVPILVLLFKVEPVLAAGTSLMMVTVSAVVGTISYARQGKVDWKGGLFLAPPPIQVPSWAPGWDRI